ncbi:NADP-dependent oxidoreductase domain-containing protein [Radiomyces spectabilis]|uniref:NADP-dependent oxidoreductase domain-containing protein n=1 Tax=Radiomyces spectabilis TaxID=64574 RepID=UPI00221F72E1|nr:NADP-dependent oxidoreductase domain-containing protein [Radiomyces spectabilis]KAI8364662.1 NADP-dependent oxidoreductase domain-containing protein [Radiomyces spectabilis]
MVAEGKMKYTRFGNTGMRVSRFCLGCMTYGNSKWEKWVKEEEESLELIGKAYKAGINFFDTAEAYSNGDSERLLGKAIKKFNMPRSRIVVATKVFFGISSEPDVNLCGTKPLDDPDMVNGFGLSRKHIFDAIEGSLERLGLDYVDLYQIHRFDYDTPLEETMEALHDLVRLGKVRYIGASSMHAWQFQKANNIAEKHGWTKFVSMQNLYNLVYREDEREMVPYCVDQGIAQIPWSPLAQGILAGKNRKSVRYDTDFFVHAFFSKNNEDVVDRVVEVANKRGISPARVALAWVLSKPYITAPIIGVGKEEHLADLLGSLELELTEEEVHKLEEAYIPRPLIPM